MKTFFLISSAILSTLLLIFSVFYYFPELPKQLFVEDKPKDKCMIAASSTSSEYRNAAQDRTEYGDYQCAIKLWKKVIKKRPTDVSALASLALLLSQTEQHQESLLYYDKLIKLGAGDSDTFAWYSRSLRYLNKIPEAIDWYYRTLSVDPNLEDITSELGELLAYTNQHYEAISLLTGYEELTGNEVYFQARKILLQTTLDNLPNIEKKNSFRIPRLYNNHFYVSARVSKNKKLKPKTFIIDTGASSLVTNKKWLRQNNVRYKVLKKMRAKIANGKVIKVTQIKIPYFQFGPFELKNIKAVICKGCEPLIGQNILNRFDMTTKRINGVDFMYLKERGK